MRETGGYERGGGRETEREREVGDAREGGEKKQRKHEKKTCSEREGRDVSVDMYIPTVETSEDKCSDL